MPANFYLAACVLGLASVAFWKRRPRPSVNFSIALFGMVLAIGLVVDDAIVVVEAVEHHIEHGLAPRDAAFKAMEEVSGPVIAIALILAAVFVPMRAGSRALRRMEF